MRVLSVLWTLLFRYRAGLSWLIAALSVFGFIALYPSAWRFPILLGLIPYIFWGPEICGLRAEGELDSKARVNDFRHLG